MSYQLIIVCCPESFPHLYNRIKLCDSQEMIFVSYDPESDGENNTPKYLEIINIIQ